MGWGMKQTITIQQFKELSLNGQETLAGMLKKQVGSVVFAELNFQEKELKKYNGTYTGVVTKVSGNTYDTVWDLKGSTGVFKYLLSAEEYHLLSLGEMIQVIQEKVEEETVVVGNVDQLWEKVKKLVEE